VSGLGGKKISYTFDLDELENGNGTDKKLALLDCLRPLGRAVP